MSPPLVHLAESVMRRRRTLGLTRDELHRAGGPSDSTVARIEGPTPTSAFPRPSTLSRLDTALQWRQGSAAGCLDLREPIPANGLEKPSTARDSRAPAAGASGQIDPLDFDYVAVPAPVLRDGLAAVQALSDRQGNSSDEVAAVVQFARQIGAAHATETLERFASAGITVPGFLQTALSPYLSEVVPAALTAPAQQEEQIYRRWLVGLLATDEPRFTERLRRKTRAIDIFAR